MPTRRPLATIAALPRDTFAWQPIYFSQQRGSCYAHCVNWLKAIEKTQDYTSYLGELGASKEFKFTRHGPTHSLQPDHLWIVPQKEGAYSRTASDLQGELMALEGNTRHHKAWSMILSGKGTTLCGSFVPETVGDRIPDEIAFHGANHTYVIFEITDSVIANRLQPDGTDRETGEKYAHHAVATASKPGTFVFFDPMVGLFGVLYNGPEKTEKLMKAWWTGVKETFKWRDDRLTKHLYD